MHKGHVFVGGGVFVFAFPCEAVRAYDALFSVFGVPELPVAVVADRASPGEAAAMFDDSGPEPCPARRVRWSVILIGMCIQRSRI